jgi:hypothetical protein
VEDLGGVGEDVAGFPSGGSAGGLPGQRPGALPERLADAEDFLGVRLGVTSERARQLTHRDDFPKPVVQLRHVRAWKAADVEAWIAEHRPGR